MTDQTPMHKPDVRKANPCPPCDSSANVYERAVYWLGIGLGSGLPRRAAGTWGTLGGLLVVIPMIMMGVYAFVGITLLGMLAGNVICGTTSRLMGVHDDPHIVWDEWVGMWIGLLPAQSLLQHAIAEGRWAYVLGVLALAFGLFRLFDIVKPFPINWVDKKVSGGFGIMLDDILAGVMTAVVLWAVLAFVL